MLVERALRAIDLQEIDTAWLSARVRRNFDAMTLGLPFAECPIYAGVEKLLGLLRRKNVNPVDSRRVRNYQLDLADVHADGDGTGAFRGAVLAEMDEPLAAIPSRR